MEYYGKSLKTVPNFYIAPVCRCDNQTVCPHSISNEEREFGRTPNGVHHVAFNQLRDLINAVKSRHGSIDEISVELVRDEWEPPKIQRIRDRNKKRNEEVVRRLDEKGLPLTQANKIRGKLFIEMEQEGRGCVCCIFCGKGFGHETIFSPEIQIEHLLPYSQTKSNNLRYLALICTPCNAKKGGRSPFEAFGNSPEYDAMVQRAPRSKQWMFEPNAMERHKEWTEGFLPRSLTDTSMIAKHSRRYLQSLTGNVWATRGGITADLRRHLGLTKDRKKDCRHHALDAFVIALVSPGLLHRLPRYEWEKERFAGPLFQEENQLAEQVQEKIQKMTVSHRMNHSLQGAILDATAYGVYRDEPRYRGWSPSAKKNQKREERLSGLENMEEIGTDSGTSPQGAVLGVKAYESKEYAYADVWQNLENEKTCVFTFTTLRSALQIKRGKKPFCQPPGGGRWRKLFRLHKGDYLQNEEGRIFRVQKFNPSGERVFFANPCVPDAKAAPDQMSCRASAIIKCGWRPVHVDILGRIKSRLPKRS